MLGAGHRYENMDWYWRFVTPQPEYALFRAIANSSVPAYSAAMDFTLAALPWTFLWNLRMEKKEKFGIAVAMSMGIM